MPFVTKKNALLTVTQQPAITKLPAGADQTTLLFAALFGANILAPFDGPDDAIASESPTADSHNDTSEAGVNDASVLQQVLTVFQYQAPSGKGKAPPAVGQEEQGDTQGSLLTETEVPKDLESIIANPLVTADIVSRPEFGNMAGPRWVTGNTSRSTLMAMANLAFEDGSRKLDNITTPRLATSSLTEGPIINEGSRMPPSPARVVALSQQFMAELKNDPRTFTNNFLQNIEPVNVTAEAVTTTPKLGMSVAAANVGIDGSTNDAGRTVMSLVGHVGGQSGHQNSHQNAGQSPGGTNYSFGATTQASHEEIMEMLDMAQDNWTEMLLNRVEASLAGGKERLEFLLNPRNLGKMIVTLGLQNDRTMVQVNTETAAAAALISESEGRLAQLMESSGLKLGQFSATQGQSGQGSTTDHYARGQGDPNSMLGNKTGAQQSGDTHQENGGQTHVSDHLINLQA